MLTLIAAVSADGFISTGKGVPWHLPCDQEHFRHITRGQWLLIGRTTYEEMVGWFQDHHPLVLTRDNSFKPAVGQAVSSVPEALRIAAEGGAQELFVCGGSGAYAAAIPSADRLVLTHVASNLYKGVPFPTFEPAEWERVSRQDFPADLTHPHALAFATYERRSTTKKLTGSPL